MSKHILVVEDEPKIREVIRSYLHKEGFLCYEASTGKEAFDLLTKHKMDLIILDLMLPDVTGEHICDTIRNISNIPIMMLTAKSAEQHRIDGLTRGADDYITKPFSPGELMARIHSVLRRVQPEHMANRFYVLQGGQFIIDEDRGEVRRANEIVHLTPIEYKILLQLVKRQGRTYKRDELIELIYGGDYEGDERAIDQHIKNIRLKIEADPKDPKWIVTVFGVGYKFTGGV